MTAAPTNRYYTRRNALLNRARCDTVDVIVVTRPDFSESYVVAVQAEDLAELSRILDALHNMVAA